MRIAVLLVGESFRKGGQSSRVRGHPESVPDQIAACASHVALFQHLANAHACNADLFICTRSTRYDADALACYAPHAPSWGGTVAWSSFFPDARRTDNVHPYIHACLDAIEATEQAYAPYHAVFVLRIDLCLKDAFKACLNPATIGGNGDRVTLPCVCMTYKRCHLCRGNQPRVNDMMAWVPKRFFERLLKSRKLKVTHDSWPQLVDLGLCEDDIGVMIDTLHDSDSFKDWNPLYRVVNRPETNNWRSPGVTFDRATKQPKTADTSALGYPTDGHDLWDMY